MMRLDVIFWVACVQLFAMEQVVRPRSFCVLMDVQMTVKDGLSATDAIQKMELQRGDSPLPIIGLTAHALPADRERCIQAGMNGF